MCSIRDGKDKGEKVESTKETAMFCEALTIHPSHVPSMLCTPTNTHSQTRMQSKHPLEFISTPANTTQKEGVKEKGEKELVDSRIALIHIRNNKAT